MVSAASMTKSATVVVVATVTVACGWAFYRLLRNNRKSGPTLRHLCVCLRDHENHAFRLKSIPVAKLFRAKKSKPIMFHEMFKDVKTWRFGEGDELFPSDSGFGIFPCNHGHPSIFYVARVPGETDGVSTSSSPAECVRMQKYDLLSDTGSVLLNETSTSLIPSKRGLVDPVVLEIKGKIYLLSVFWRMLEESPELINLFQVYDPTNDTWETLPSPPFFAMPCYLKYVVKDDNFLCVSSYFHSSAFNFSVKEWNSCDLFKDVIDSEMEFERLPYSWPDFYKRYKGDDYVENPLIGPPLPFLNRAVVINDKFLLCLRLGSADVLAFKIDTSDGNIHEMPQVLITWEDLPWRSFDCCGFVDMGSGYFCFMVAVYIGRHDTIPSRLKFFMFKVSISEDGENLICDESETKAKTVTLAPQDYDVFSFFGC